VVFAVDGSACLRHIGDDLRRAVYHAYLPLQVLDFPWSYGPGRVFADLRCVSHHKAKGQELAGLILAYRQSCPDATIHLVCHSSGAAVVLSAAEDLPPGSVDRIVLLAPAVSSGYNLRPALACAREGIDCFYSPWDLTSCSLGLVGTTDGCHLPSAGCLGFTSVVDGQGGRGYQNLRQHRWSVAMREVGHFGGHYGCTHFGFFQAYVVPLLAEEADRK
jgi:pimeloyl-ACP methyl ester carboxylesterase